MARKTPEEKAAQRRAAFERRAAQTAAVDRKSQERAEAEAANHVAIITALARQLAAAGKPFEFRTLGIAVLDGVVYTTKDGLRKVGPFAGADITVQRLPDKQYHRSGLNQFVFMAPPVGRRARFSVSIVTSEGTATFVREQQVNGSAFVQNAMREGQDLAILARQALPGNTP
jgi:hypothetical protein